MNLNIFVIALPLLCLLPQVAPAQAATKIQLAAISEMGRLNGIALQCGYLDETRRIKMALIRALPKQRALGQWFEQETNASFMSFIQDNRNCPPLAEFAQDLEQGESDLEASFQ